MVTKDEADPRRELLSDLFHALNQPLTTLLCSLELALGQLFTAEQYQQSLRSALDQAQNVAWLTAGIRELVEASNRGEFQAVELDCYLSEAIEEWTPVAHFSGHRLLLKSSRPCTVSIEPSKLRQVLFYCFEWTLNSARSGLDIGINLLNQDDGALLTIDIPHPDLCLESLATKTLTHKAEMSSQENNGREIKQRLRLGLARAIVEAAGGSLELHRQGEISSLEVRLPLRN
jgi:signal transduction histidine kinase